ncbi:hypothetical protein [Calothrix sp. NIES-2100]|uniref:hypothetical protein n=1 Tax=Calothrix sp. NIES-2100 TaxID=1954172 RepID=UPI0030DB59A9
MYKLLVLAIAKKQKPLLEKSAAKLANLTLNSSHRTCIDLRQPLLASDINKER